MRKVNITEKVLGLRLKRDTQTCVLTCHCRPGDVIKYKCKDNLDTRGRENSANEFKLTHDKRETNEHTTLKVDES